MMVLEAVILIFLANFTSATLLSFSYSKYHAVSHLAQTKNVLLAGEAECKWKEG